ncbi:MAG: TlpA family protein disulfide reductase [Planctomycetaceae bacterium]|nr:TlpA family protein disulfide reductase [Planctomycetaceae bacterium]
MLRVFRFWLCVCLLSATPRLHSANAEEPADAVIQQARALIDAGRLGRAVGVVEQGLASDPTNLQLLLMHVDYLHQLTLDDLDQEKFEAAGKQASRAAGSLQQLVSLKETLKPADRQFLQDVHYDFACVNALQSQPAEAIKSLRQAVAWGFTGAEDLEQDEDLAVLRNSQEFRALLADVKGKARTEILAALNRFEAYPFVFSAQNVLGGEISSKGLEGKLVIVDFWGTWCPPCRREIPHLIELRKKYSERGLEVVGLSYENDTDEAATKLVQGFVEKNGVNYPCVIGTEAMQSQVKVFEGFPTLLVIDRRGRVRLSLSGYHPPYQLEAVVEALLAEKN